MYLFTAMIPPITFLLSLVKPATFIWSHSKLIFSRGYANINLSLFRHLLITHVIVVPGLTLRHFVEEIQQFFSGSAFNLGSNL